MKKVPEKVKEIRRFVAKAEENSKSISFSQLSLYVACPNKWYRAYVLKEMPYVPTIHTVFGTAFHETMQKWLEILYNESVKASESFDFEEFLYNRMREIYVKEREDTGEDFTTPEELYSFYEDGIAILEYVRKNRKSYFSSKGEWLVGCEIPILYPLRPGFYFRGFIDFLIYDEVLDTWKIFDIKTSTSGWSPETKADKNKTDQVLLYKRFLSKQFGIDEEKISTEYFIVKRKIREDAEYASMKRRVQEFVPSNGKVSLNKAEGKVVGFCNDVLEEDGSYKKYDYPKNPSEHNCKWCLFNGSCAEAVLGKNSHRW